MAEILSISDTGVTVNDNPRVVLRLFVQPRSRTGFETTTKLFVSRLSLAAFQPGSKIQVRFDPNDLQKVAVDLTATNTPPSPQSTLIASSGFAPQPARATAIVLSAVEGEPAGRLKILSLLLEVHVADRPPGSGLCRAVAREVQAGDETRTRDIFLGKEVLYQLSYTRVE